MWHTTGYQLTARSALGTPLHHPSSRAASLQAAGQGVRRKALHLCQAQPHRLLPAASPAVLPPAALRGKTSHSRHSRPPPKQQKPTHQSGCCSGSDITWTAWGMPRLSPIREAGCQPGCCLACPGSSAHCKTRDVPERSATVNLTVEQHCKQARAGHPSSCCRSIDKLSLIQPASTSVVCTAAGKGLSLKAGMC